MKIELDSLDSLDSLHSLATDDTLLMEVSRETWELENSEIGALEDEIPDENSSEDRIEYSEDDSVVI